MRIRELDTQGLMDRCRGEGLYYGVGPFVVRLRCSLPEVVREIAFLYSDFPVLDRDALVSADVFVRPRWGGTIDVFVNGRRQYKRLGRELAVPYVEWSLNLTVFEGLHRYFMVHASVVAMGDRVAIMPGDAGFGKSTLCAALVASGWRLLSDEVALFRPGDERIVAVPRPISLKEGSIEIIRSFAPDAVIGPSWPGTMKGTVAHVLPPLESVEETDRPGDPTWIVFPRYSSGARTSFRPVSRARALIRAASHAFNYGRFGRAGFEILAGAVDASECLELAYSDLDEAVGNFAELAASPATEGAVKSR